MVCSKRTTFPIATAVNHDDNQHVNKHTFNAPIVSIPYQIKELYYTR